MNPDLNMRTNTELVREFISAYNKFDIDSMVELLHPDIIFTNISDGEVNVQTSGKHEFEVLARQSANLFTKREQTITSLSEKDHVIVLNIQYSAVLAVDMGEFKTGDSLNLSGISEYTFKDGLIYSIIDQS